MRLIVTDMPAFDVAKHPLEKLTLSSHLDNPRGSKTIPLSIGFRDGLFLNLIQGRRQVFEKHV